MADRKQLLSGLSRGPRLLGRPECFGTASHLTPEVAIEKGELAEAAFKGDFDNRFICLRQVVTRSLQAKMIEKIGIALAHVLLELTAKCRLAHAVNLEHVLEVDLLAKLGEGQMQGQSTGRNKSGRVRGVFYPDKSDNTKPGDSAKKK